MIKLFVEYQIKQAYMPHYLQQMQMLSDFHPGFEWLKSTEQDNLFLEIYTFADEVAAEDFRVERGRKAKDRWLWDPENIVKGGKAGMRMWTFHTLNSKNRP